MLTQNFMRKLFFLFEDVLPKRSAYFDGHDRKEENSVISRGSRFRLALSVLLQYFVVFACSPTQDLNHLKIGCFLLAMGARDFRIKWMVVARGYLYMDIRHEHSDLAQKCPPSVLMFLRLMLLFKIFSFLLQVFFYRCW